MLLQHVLSGKAVRRYGAPLKLIAQAGMSLAKIADFFLGVVWIESALCIISRPQRLDKKEQMSNWDKVGRNALRLKSLF